MAIFLRNKFEISNVFLFISSYQVRYSLVYSDILMRIQKYISFFKRDILGFIPKLMKDIHIEYRIIKATLSRCFA